VILDSGEGLQQEPATYLSGVGNSRVHIEWGEGFNLDGKVCISVAIIWRLDDQTLEFDQPFTVIPGDMKGVRVDLGFRETPGTQAEKSRQYNDRQAADEGFVDEKADPSLNEQGNEPNSQADAEHDQPGKLCEGD